MLFVAGSHGSHYNGRHNGVALTIRAGLLCYRTAVYIDAATAAVTGLQLQLWKAKNVLMSQDTACVGKGSSYGWQANVIMPHTGTLVVEL